VSVVRARSLRLSPRSGLVDCEFSFCCVCGVCACLPRIHVMCITSVLFCSVRVRVCVCVCVFDRRTVLYIVGVLYVVCGSACLSVTRVNCFVREFFV